MKRKFLYEILDELAQAEDFEAAFFDALDYVRGFKDLVDVIYNKNYNYEVDKSIFDTKPRSDRENGGFPSSWLDVVVILKNKLVRSTITSPRCPDYYIKACKNCNIKDVDILNYAIYHRNFPGFQGARKKFITNALKKYYGDDNGETF